MTEAYDNTAGDDQIHAERSQGFITSASGPISQNFGEQTTIDSGGGDVIGGDKVQGDKVMGDKTIIIQPPPLSQALHQLRAPVGDFVGREREIEMLVQALSKAATSGTAAAISGVRGLGGIGKTELAYAAAGRLAAHFPDAQLLVELRGASSSPLSPQQALQTLIRAFEREAKLPDDLNELRNIYCSVLAGKRALILADDTRDAAQVRVLLPPAGCALLVTSRNRFMLPGMAALDLGMLPPEEAEKLLLEICPRIGEQAPGLARLCGYLPLALRISAGLLANSSRRVERYLEQLAAERLSHLADPDDSAASVEASLRLSYDALERAAQTALSQMSVFGASFDLAAALAVVEVEGDAEALVDMLGRRSLLEWDATTERYSLHDLVRAFAAARLEHGDAVRLRHARHYEAILRTANQAYQQGGAALMQGLMLFDTERINIETGQSWSAAHVGDDDTAAQLCTAYPGSGWYVLSLRHTPRTTIRWSQPALEAARRLKDRGMEGAHLGNLGLAYANLGEIRRAIECYEQQLMIMREVENKWGEGAALGNLGIAYKNLGDAHKAITFYEQYLLIARELGDRHGEGNALGNLGNAYYLLADAHKAISFYEQALLIDREIGDRRGEGNALSGLGLAYAALGDAHKATSFYEQQLVIVREIGDRRGEGNALGNLGLAYAALGDAHKAISFYEQQLVIVREIGDRRGEGPALGNLGLAYADIGDAHKAISFYEQAMDVAREIGDREGEARHSWNLGLALEQQSELARAVELMQVYVEYLGEIGHPDAEGRTAYLEQVRQRLASDGGGETPRGLRAWWRRLSGRR
jgi:tetratricopeptide (TPR) repeat protein